MKDQSTKEQNDRMGIGLKERPASKPEDQSNKRPEPVGKETSVRTVSPASWRDLETGSD